MLRVVTALSELISAQLTENGGGSLVDKVAQIKVIKEDLETVKNHVARLSKSLESLTKFEAKE